MIAVFDILYSVVFHLRGQLFVHAISLLNDLRWPWNALAKDMALHEVWQPNLQLVADEVLRWNGEDLVELFQRELLCLTHEAEDQEPGDQV